MGKYNWDSGITERVKENFLRIAQKRMKGIVSQAKTSGERPVWISPTLWTQMWEHWNTPDAVEKSSNASQSRLSDRGGLGVHKHVSGQKSHLQVHQEMEEELKRPVSLGEVFMKTHTRADGSYVDQKAKQVAEAYEKHIEEVISEMDFDGLDTTEHSSEQTTQRTLSIQEKDDIFLKSTVTDDRGVPFGLGRLGEKINKGKRKECYASPSSSDLLEIQEQLQSARRRIAEQDNENARRDEEHHNAQTRISTLEMLVSFLRNNRVSRFYGEQSTPSHCRSKRTSKRTSQCTSYHTNQCSSQPIFHFTNVQRFIILSLSILELLSLIELLL